MNCFAGASLIIKAIDGASVNMPMPSSSDPDWAHLNDLPRPFDVICEDLAALGALSLQDFLSGTTSTAADFDVSFHLQSIVLRISRTGHGLHLRLSHGTFHLLLILIYLSCLLLIYSYDSYQMTHTISCTIYKPKLLTCNSSWNFNKFYLELTQN